MNRTRIDNDMLLIDKNYEVKSKAVLGNMNKYLNSTLKYYMNYFKKLNIPYYNIIPIDFIESNSNDEYDKEYGAGNYIFIDLSAVKKIVGKVEDIRKCNNRNIVFRYEKVLIFADMLTISLMEYYLYLWREIGLKVEFWHADKRLAFLPDQFKKVRSGISYRYATCAATDVTAISKTVEDKDMTGLKMWKKDTFDSIFWGDKYTYKKRLVCETIEESTTISNDCFEFLVGNNIDEEIALTIVEMLIELIPNALEHGQASCMIDVFFNEDILSLAIYNFSEKLLWTDLDDKIFGDDRDKYTSRKDRMETVRQAKDNHIKFFGDDYLEDDFKNIMCFQSVSGRKADTEAGGTGLKSFLKNMRELTKYDACYVLSGHNCVMFEEDFINPDSNNYIGFNETKDFLNDRPASVCIQHSDYYMPGVAYNFIFKTKE